MVKKSENMISAIGFRPVIAAPIATHDRLLRDRAIAYAPLTPAVQPDRRLEHAAGLGHVLAEEDHVGIARHLLGDAAGDGVTIGQFRHAKPPSA